MFNFFAEETSKNNNCYIICGSDFNHIKNVLRIQPGDTFLVSCNGQSDLCRLESFNGESVIAEIIEENYRDTELPIKIFLFQGLPKSDKMELIIQKCVELGVTDIIPVETNRCVVKIEDKKKSTKQSRWQSISESAAKQSKRNIIPTIHNIISYKQALEKAQELDLVMIAYENKEGMKATKDFLCEIKQGMSVGIFIGPEGGFDEKEVELASSTDIKTVSLGERILRTETAAITSVGMCMLYAEFNLSGDNQ